MKLIIVINLIAFLFHGSCSPEDRAGILLYRIRLV
jgi:hypothetical protein